MHHVNTYRNILLEEYYLDSNQEVRRKKDGYLGRFKKDDLAKFFVGSNGYIKFQIPTVRKTMNKSHLVYLLNTSNSLPDDQEIDHIDGKKQNDHPDNLRVVNRRTNNCNRKKRSDNTSGITGIRWSDYHGHYVIRRTINGKRYSTSRQTLEEAKQVLLQITNQDSDYSQRHGK